VSSSFVGVVRAVHDLSKLPTRLAPLATLSAQTRTPTGGAKPRAVRVDFEDATIAYGSHVVVSHVTLRVGRGEAVALVGANGSGKSTLLLAVLGLRPLALGSIRLGDVDVEKLDASAWRRSVAYLPQRPYLLPRRDVRAAMRFPQADTDSDALEQALRRVGLWDRLASFPGDPWSVATDSLSAGERQRLALARVLSRPADAYILDEPDANLDVQGVKWVADLIRELVADGKLVIVAAHTPEVIAAADRVVQLADGRATEIDGERSRAAKAM
jgi:ATP-binding cassette subfamily C protein CydD/ATP-binding cassette subfamily C protein CydCD